VLFGSLKSMTRSYNLTRYPDADYTPNDIEPVASRYSWDDFHDDETNEMIMRERKYF